MLKKNLATAEYISDIIDLFQLAGGFEHYKKDLVINNIFKFLYKFEKALWQLEFFNDNQDQIGLHQLKLLQMRGSGLIESWNSFNLAVIKEKFIPVTNNNWQSILFWRFSSYKSYLIANKSLFAANFNLFKALINLDLNRIVETIENQFLKKEQKIINPLILIEKDSLDIKLFNSFNSELETAYKDWKNFWQESSGGIVAQANNFRYENKALLIQDRVNNNELKLIGLDQQKLAINQAIENFIGGFKNNLYLWGEPGTGKSSIIFDSVKKYSQIKIVNLDFKQIEDLPKISHYLNSYVEKFILLADDWSFLEAEINLARSLKVFMDKELSASVNQVLWVISNKQHLINPNNKLDLQSPEYSQLQDEASSLDDRFGVKIYFEAPRFEKLKEFFNEYVKINNPEFINDSQLFKKFTQFAMNNQLDRPSGRAIYHFFNKITAK